MPARKKATVRPLTTTEKIRAQIGASPATSLRLGLPDAWAEWDKRYGPAFRLRHGLGKHGDEERLEALGELPALIPPPPGI